MDHTLFDKRGYPIVEVREGYGEWARTYEQVVQDEMDLRLLDRLTTPDWAAQHTVLDMACGTGRIGAWLKTRTNAAIDGLDITAEMMAKAAARGIYRSLRLADVGDTGLPAGSYDLCVQSLADEHMADLRPLYREVARVVRPGGLFVLVGYHPQFLMAGMPTHFDRETGEPITIRSYVHLLSDHVKIARAAGMALLEMDEGIIDDAWLVKKPKWQVYRGQPISFALVWQVGG